MWKTKVSEYPDDKIGGIMMAKDKLLVGLTRCNVLDARDHCFIAGYEASTGKLLWKFYTVARKGMPGGDTWGDLTDDQRSGADAWIAGTYDPQLNLAFWGTGQAKGSSRDQRGSNGDALYSNTTLALDPDTGTLKWYFQNAPGETLDLDEVFERVLIDHGQQKTVMTVGKSGLMWKLDRVTGKFLDVKETVFQNVWAAIDMKTGRTTYRDDILEKKPGQAVASCPSPSGGHNWQSTSYDPVERSAAAPAQPELRDVRRRSAVVLRDAGNRRQPGTPVGLRNRHHATGLELSAAQPVPDRRHLHRGRCRVRRRLQPRRSARSRSRPGRRCGRRGCRRRPRAIPSTFSVGGEQFVAVPTGYNGGSPRESRRTMLRGEIQRPTIGHGVYVFGLPKRTVE